MAKQHNTDTVLLSTILFHALFMSSEFAGAELQAHFIFGDSIADVGTNNYVEGSLATANNPYYGIDYPDSTATGRFSNGYNTVDYIVKLLGGYYNESPPAYLKLVQSMSNFQSNIQLGVNFASGGAGIFDDTGSRPYHKVVNFSQQLEQFETVCGNLTEALGADKAAALINNSLYIISVGSNDLFDYFRYPQAISVPELISYLISAYANRLKILYDQGARKFGILGIAPIGCCPAIRSVNGGACNDTMNEAAQSFQGSTLTLLQNFSSQNPGVYYSLGNSYFMAMSVINKTNAVFADVENACCGEGQNNGRDKCKTTSTLCTDRDSYLFFDLYHPTDRAAELAATFLVTGGEEFVTPMNFNQLAAIQV